MASMSDALVQQLLNGRYIASLATHQSNGSIHVVAVWYWFNGSHIYVATSTRTRKARNIQSNPRISLMIDARDPDASFGTNITGPAKFVTGEGSKKLNLEIHRKYLSASALADARIGPVFSAWDDVTIEITPAAVVAWDMRVADKQVFGGAFASNPGYLLPLDR
jgi:nitroimidazol reductase NimA-like FMN-containing flavoprotein (pyridoxamine 5'-phosphate oxidase superfamily)